MSLQFMSKFTGKSGQYQETFQIIAQKHSWKTFWQFLVCLFVFTVSLFSNARMVHCNLTTYNFWRYSHFRAKFDRSSTLKCSYLTKWLMSNFDVVAEKCICWYSECVSERATSGKLKSLCSNSSAFSSLRINSFLSQYDTLLKVQQTF